MSAKPAYSIRSLMHAFDGKTVLRIPQLDMAAGEISALVGPNGSGKTTLLRILALLLEPLTGSVVVDGVAAMSGKSRRQLRRRVTLIHQKPVLFSTTVWNNVAYGLRASGFPAKEIKTRVGAALEEFGLSGAAGMQARKLSGGEAQRAVLARGLVLQTPILLLDEPTSFLDEAIRPLLLEQLHAAKEERGATIVLATHDLGIVSALSSQVIRLKQGEIEPHVP